MVIERDPAREAELAASGLLFVIGSALEDRVLEEAGLPRARAIVVVTASDAENVFITLSARAMNPSIHIHARGETEVGLQHLRMAGADQAVAAYQWARYGWQPPLCAHRWWTSWSFRFQGVAPRSTWRRFAWPRAAHCVGQSISALEQSSTRLRIVALKVRRRHRGRTAQSCAALLDLRITTATRRTPERRGRRQAIE